MANIVIGIEGLVGAGKTSICRELIKIIPNTVLLNGGNLYRAIVYAMIKNGGKLEELKAKGKSLDIKEMMDFFKIEIKIENKDIYKIEVNDNGDYIEFDLSDISLPFKCYESLEELNKIQDEMLKKAETL